MERINERQLYNCAPEGCSVRESNQWGCFWYKQGRHQGGAFAGRVPQTSYCAPTFLPLPSLLNVIDFESESGTVHIRKQLHALASISYCTRSQIARFTPQPQNIEKWYFESIFWSCMYARFLGSVFLLSYSLCWDHALTHSCISVSRLNKHCFSVDLAGMSLLLSPWQTHWFPETHLKSTCNPSGEISELMITVWTFPFFTYATVCFGISNICWR